MVLDGGGGVYLHPGNNFVAYWVPPLSSSPALLSSSRISPTDNILPPLLYTLALVSLCSTKQQQQQHSYLLSLFSCQQLQALSLPEPRAIFGGKLNSLKSPMNLC
jgi:hypothetical protein